MTKEKIMLRMLVSRTELATPFPEPWQDDCDPEEEADAEDENGDAPAYENNPEELPEPTELLLEGELVTDGHRTELIYEEDEFSGMAGTLTTIGFDRTQPEVITLMRSGIVRTALVFEKNRRHMCLYNTPFSDFEICVHALRVENRICENGTLELDYLIEIHGACAEHCKISIDFHRIEE